MEIVGFHHKGLERFWARNDTRGIPAKNAEKLRAMLAAIEEAVSLRDMERYPGWRLHRLSGNRADVFSMVVTRNLRLTFRVRKDAVEDVDLEDYH